MTIYRFLSLDEAEQMEFFWDGVYIGERFEDEHKFICHQVDGFYVEYKKHIEWDVYRGMRACKNPDLLQPYLER